MADFTSRFNELLSRSTATDTEIASALGVSKQTISAWKNGVRFPKKPALRTIADFFNVGVPWLSGISDDEAIIRDVNSQFAISQLSPTETELVAIYRDLNAKGQQTLMGTARGLHANPDMKKNGTSDTVEKLSS